MLNQIAYYMIFGKPIIMYLGLLNYALLIFTASIAVMNKKNIHIIPFRWHPRVAIITIVMITIHAILGLAKYF